MSTNRTLASSAGSARVRQHSAATPVVVVVVVELAGLVVVAAAASVPAAGTVVGCSERHSCWTVAAADSWRYSQQSMTKWLPNSVA